MAIPIPLQEALRDSITSGTFIDTKFWVPSNLGSKSGRVGGLKALFVNGYVARSVPRLGFLLDEKGAKGDLRATFPADRRPYENDYEYEDDSDLEEDDEEDTSYNEPTSPPQVATEKPGDNTDVASIENSDAKSNESLDIVSVSDLDSLFSEPFDVNEGEVGTASSAHVGKVVVIEDIAFVTFQALLRYLYTNEIEFAPWGSTERQRARTFAGYQLQTHKKNRKNKGKSRGLEKTPKSHEIPKPSPKSIYRLADKYGIPELKELALRQIQQDLIKCDIVEEVFSKYTSWYPELRELGIRQLARALVSSDSGPVLEALKTKIKHYANGKLTHAEDVLPVLYELMESDESIEETPLPAAASSNQPVIGGDWDGLKKALTSSLTSDSSKLGARGKPLPRCADECDSDIDDETPGPEGTTECYPRKECVRENPAPTNSPMEPARLLKSGAIKTWSAIFLFVYTGQITFAPIRSQGVPSSETKKVQEGRSPNERNAPHDSGGLSVPPPGAVVAEPCSPKSIYCQANKVGLTGLCDIAFKDIQSKLNENNIVQELFSPFTAGHKRIRDMEHELFQSKLKPSASVALLSKTIRSTSSGENPHRAAAMELVFDRSIRERRKRTYTKVKNTLQPDPTPLPKRDSGGSNVSIPQAQSPTPASQSSPRLSPNAGPDPLARLRDPPPHAKYEASTHSKPAKKSKAAGREERPADAKTNPPPSKNIVQLAYQICISCETIRLVNVEACTNCHGKFA